MMHFIGYRLSCDQCGINSDATADTPGILYTLTHAAGWLRSKDDRDFCRQECLDKAGAKKKDGQESLNL